MKDWLFGGVVLAIGGMVITILTVVFLQEPINRLAEMLVK